MPATVIPLPYLVGSAAFAFLACLVLPWLIPAAAQSRVAMNNSLRIGEEDSTDLPPPVDSRVQFASSSGATVFGWPSKGGIYVSSPSFGVELDIFFGELDRFRNKERPLTFDVVFQSDEEAHCDKSKSTFRQQAYNISIWHV